MLQHSTCICDRLHSEREAAHNLPARCEELVGGQRALSITAFPTAQQTSEKGRNEQGALQSSAIDCAVLGDHVICLASQNAGVPERADPVGPDPPGVDVALGNDEAAQHKNYQEAEGSQRVCHDHIPSDGAYQPEQAHSHLVDLQKVHIKLNYTAIH